MIVLPSPPKPRTRTTSWQRQGGARRRGRAHEPLWQCPYSQSCLEFEPNFKPNIHAHRTLRISNVQIGFVTGGNTASASLSRGLFSVLLVMSWSSSFANSPCAHRAGLQPVILSHPSRTHCWPRQTRRRQAHCTNTIKRTTSAFTGIGHALTRTCRNMA